jgi:hypothetical protein
MHTTTMQNFITIGSVVYERIEDKQTNILVCFIYIYTSCTLRALLRLQFNLNEILYFVLIVFIEELLNTQYFLFFLLVCTRINRKVFQRVSKLHTVGHVRSMYFPNLVHTLITMFLCFVDGHCKRLNSNDISVRIIGMCGNRTSSPLNFTFKIVTLMISFIIFFTGHLVTGHLVT